MELKRTVESGKQLYASHRRVGLVFRSRLLWLAPILALILGLGYKEIKSYWIQPQAVLVLGGATEREIFAAQFAHQHPNLPVWVSSGSNREYAEWVFSQAGISPTRLHLDYQAVDTVTNFTTVVGQLQARGIRSIYLVTSDYHMARARVIGEIVLGSRGIDFKPIVVTSQEASEPVGKSIRDGFRALLWLATGKTGESLQGKF
ncbi:MAG: YdcF family protein [Leptolyngbyaceae bacterium]|nr:YdcF family protein [Leptolyngbyaceae bacterium]